MSTADEIIQISEGRDNEEFLSDDEPIVNITEVFYNKILLDTYII